MKIRYALLPSILAATLALTACGGGATPPDTSGAASNSNNTSTHSEFNDADVAFAAGMIPHHQQALTMSEIVLEQPELPEEVRALAEEIHAAQEPEIATMTAWLEAWGEDPSSHAGHSMDGMLSDSEMNELRAAEGDAAAELFLTGMIQHHKGAVAMAEQELAEGTNPDALALAKEIIDAQTAEIQHMQALLGQEPAAASRRAEHVHGLQVVDGEFILATHHGFFRAPVTWPGEDGAAEKVAWEPFGPEFDAMGFTVAADGRFLASGHPGPGLDLPNPVGLIASDDDGATWSALSRAGESDFHALTVSQDAVVGYDGELRRSTDGKTWQSVTAGPDAYALAGNGTDPVVLATTPEGVWRSEDQGQNWAPVKDSPVLMLTAIAGNTAVGIAPDGAAYASSDAGRSWTATGQTLSRPAALTAATSPDGSVVAWTVTQESTTPVPLTVP